MFSMVQFQNEVQVVDSFVGRGEWRPVSGQTCFEEQTPQLPTSRGQRREV
ncbi:hypothetical protein EXN66_Car013981 [Channa argus]|uniref:Uncharacterized protein n=1 Tax=Channa argus TaxID=215402 RepID=A0A6G1Q6N8_CHAAH|nr:hypothetical protein EXN66_Car013981 [Channa argus]